MHGERSCSKKLVLSLLATFVVGNSIDGVHALASDH